jgi:hypothetical protein
MNWRGSCNTYRPPIAGSEDEMETTATRERPILFRTELVKKILSGAKTQTRRPVKPQPDWFESDIEGGIEFNHPVTSGTYSKKSFARERCPFGQVGDVLWVRERWAIWNDSKDPSHEIVLFASDESAWWNPKDFAEYFSQPFSAGRWMEAEFNPLEHGLPVKWKPSIHMPRWACRLRLEITDVRVERVQDISEADAVAEGMEPWVECWAPHPLKPQSKPRFMGARREATCREAFEQAWNAAYPGSWDRSDWVWAITFKKLESR